MVGLQRETLNHIVLVTGSRSWDDFDFIAMTLDGLFGVLGSRMVLMHGACPKGADQLADLWTATHQPMVPVIRVPADWGRDGRRGGILRNMRMVVDMGPLALCVAFIRDDSAGATQCARYARSRGVPTVIHSWDERW